MILQDMIHKDGSLTINKYNLKIITKVELLDYIRFLNNISTEIFSKNENIEIFIKRLNRKNKMKIVHLINMYIHDIKRPITISKKIKGISNKDLISVEMKKTVNKIV